MKKGDVWIGSSGLRLIFRVRNKGSWEVEVERRKVDRSTGEITIYKNTRVVLDENVQYLLADYKPEKK